MGRNDVNMYLKTRRITALFAALILLLTGSGISFAESASYNSGYYEEARGVLNALEIYTGGGVAQSVTRMEALRALTALREKIVPHIASGDDEKVYFYDVDESDREAVSIALRSGMICLSDDGCFYPDMPADYSFLEYACESLAGYNDEMRKSKSMGAAPLLNLRKNLRADMGSEIKTGDFCVILYNLLNSNYITLVNNDLSKETIMESVFRTYKRTARLVSLYNSDIGENIRAAKGDAIFKSGSEEYTLFCGELDVDEFMGRSCKVFYNIDDEKIVYICPARDDLICHISAGEFQDFSEDDRILSYKTVVSGSHWGKTYRRESVKIPKTADIIYNGQFTLKHSEVYNALSGNTLNIGDIYLYDTNGDGAADLVSISAYYDIRVEAVLESEGNVIDKITKKSYNFIPKSENAVDLTIRTSSGKSLTLGSLSKGDIISVYEGLADYKKIVIVKSEKDITGICTRLTNDGYALIDDEEYKLSNTFIINGGSIKIGESSRFLLNAGGEIAAVVSSDKAFRSIGAVVSANKYADGDAQARITIFSVDGESETYITREKWYIDDSPVYEKNDALYFKQNGEEKKLKSLNAHLVHFKTDADGKISKITFPKKDASNGELSFSGGMTDADRIYENPNAYKLRYKTNGSTFIPAGSGSANMNFIVTDSDTKFIKIPSSSAEYISPESFSTVSGISNDYESACIGYSLTSGSYISDIVVMISDSTSSIDADSRDYVVKNISVAVNKENVAAKKIECYERRGSVVVFETESEYIPNYSMQTGKITDDEAEIGIGDVIKVSVGSNGLCNAVAKIVDADKQKCLYSSNPEYWYAGNRIVFGSVYAVDGRVIAYMVGKEPSGTNAAGSLQLHGLRSDLSVIVVDTEKKREEAVKIGSYNDFIGYTTDAANYSHIFLSTSYGEQNMVVCYK